MPVQCVGGVTCQWSVGVRECVCVCVCQIVNRQTHGVSSQARLRINATDSAQYSCHAENVHKHGLTSIARSATVRVVGQSFPSEQSPHFRTPLSVTHKLHTSRGSGSLWGFMPAIVRGRYS